MDGQATPHQPEGADPVTGAGPGGTAFGGHAGLMAVALLPN